MIGADVDLLLDAAAVINTSVLGERSSVRSAHVDLPRKTGLFYLRHPEDTATGGDLERYRFKDGVPYGFRDNPRPVPRTSQDHRLPPQCVGDVLNPLFILHGVPPRSMTNVLRRLCTRGNWCRINRT